ncbi:MAG: hypothetical protein WBG42_17350 [Cryomorphaceae bacterium]
MVKFIPIIIGTTLALLVSGSDWHLPTDFGAAKLLIQTNKPNKILKA